MLSESANTVVDLDEQGVFLQSKKEDPLQLDDEGDVTFKEITGTIGSKSGGSKSDDDDGSESEDEVELLSASKAKKSAAMWKLEYWQGFFDVDTNEVLYRLLASINPRQNFIRTIRPNADLYGPVWVCTTLSFAILVAGNLSNYLQYYSRYVDKQPTGEYHWHYRFHVVTQAAVVIFAYGWLVPVLIWLLLWWRNSKSGYSLLEILSTYGYSLFVFIPVSVLWIIPLVSLQWILISFGVMASGGVLVRTFWPAFKADNKTVAAFVMLLIFAMHAAIGIGFQVYFFKSISGDSTITTNATSRSTQPTGTNSSNVEIP